MMKYPDIFTPDMYDVPADYTGASEDIPATPPIPHDATTAAAPPATTQIKPSEDLVRVDEETGIVVDEVLAPPTMADFEPEEEPATPPVTTVPQAIKGDESPEAAADNNEPPQPPDLPPVGGASSGDFSEDDGGMDDNEETDASPAGLQDDGDIVERPTVREELQEVETQLQEITQRADSLTARVKAELGDTAEEQLNDAYDLARSEFPEDAEVDSKVVMESALRILAERIGAERWADVGPPLRDLVTLDDRERVLNERKEVLAHTECVRLSEEIVETVDWDRLLHKIGVQSLEGMPPHAQAFFEALCKDGIQPQYSSGTLPVLDSWIEYCTEQDLVRDEAAPAPDADALERQRQWLPDDNLRGASHAWRRLTYQTFTYLSPEREDEAARALSKTSNQLYELDLVLSYLGMDKAQVTDVPEQITTALKRCMATAFEEFDRADIAFMKENLQQGPLYIKNGELAAEKLGIADPRAWVEDKMYSYPDGFPPFYLRGLTSVRFTDEYKEERINEKDRKRAVKTRGHYDMVDRDMVIGVIPLLTEDRQLLYKLHMNVDSAKASIRERSAKSARETWDHEATHYAHNHTLPILWLREWHKIAAEEPVMVTDYVASMYEKSRSDGACEDLADSVKLYKNMPGKLLAQGGYERFRKINEILRLYNARDVEHLIRYAKDNHTDDPLGKHRLWFTIEGSLRG